MTGSNRSFLLGGAILASAAAACFGVQRLREEHDRLATFEAIAHAGARSRAPLMVRGMAVAGSDRRQAATWFQGLLSSAAAGHRLLVERLEVLPAERDAPALLAVDLAISGTESDIRRFAGTIETGRPAIRFERWKVARTAAGESSVRIDARAVALWDRGI